MRKGIGVSPGVAVGTAYCIHEIFVSPGQKRLADAEVLPELARYERARDKAAADLAALRRKVAKQVGEEEAAIFQVHEAILQDPAFTSKLRKWICDERLTAQAALHRFLNEYGSLFARTKDEYIKERLSDVRDVIVRLSGYLSDVIHDPSAEDVPDKLIVVAAELLPSQVVMLGDRNVAGIVTESGGPTSHAAILARSHGIPAVCGVRGILRQVTNGDTVVVDGREGMIDVNPGTEAESAYRKLEREFFHLKDELAANRHLEAKTADGERLVLLANVNNVHDADVAEDMGADGVGLYRTEYLFLTHPNIPDEEEQVTAYREMIAASPNHCCTIRTLDIGGDKTLAYMGKRQEANPFLGWRSIRLSFEHPEFFMSQIRAILRAGAAEQGTEVDVKIMFPMITTIEELRRVRAMVTRAKRTLAAEGTAFADVPIGLMLEVPAAAMAIDLLLEVADFVSIGSNDLVQYLMAADRDNPKVSHLCQPLAPAVVRTLHHVITTCNEVGKPVTLCGEMAGSPRAFLLLYALGLRSFSMSPAFVPTIKELCSHLNQDIAREIHAHVGRLKTTTLVNRYLAEQVQKLAPNLEMLDMA
jgi:phosphotransferase system enzyme I (PtsI)